MVLIKSHYKDSVPSGFEPRSLSICEQLVVDFILAKSKMKQASFDHETDVCQDLKNFF